MSEDILVVCPQAVVPAWGLQVETYHKKEPWKHQRDACEWVLGRRASMLALDMGTGKTLTALMATCKPDANTLLLGRGSTKSRAAKLKKAMLVRPKANGLIVVVNYDSVWRGELAKFIGGHKWKAIILDESHRIKSPGGKASRWLASLARASPQARLPPEILESRSINFSQNSSSHKLDLTDNTHLTSYTRLSLNLKRTHPARPWSLPAPGKRHSASVPI